jgi:L-asparaginase/Glu-tRNA(Gln) amidotransferase subunit D
MPLSSVDIITSWYSFFNREKEWLIDVARQYFNETFSAENILFIGYGGTISSGYSPSWETIIPLIDSPAIRSVDYLNNFSISNIEYNHIPLLAKDSRMINDEDIFLLLDIIFLCPNQKICITLGTYLGPRIALILSILSSQLGNKKIIFTWSMLPSGFASSDADANIWSAITTLELYSKYFREVPKVGFVFHGQVYDTKDQIEKINLHPESSKDIILEYPDLLLPIHS